MDDTSIPLSSQESTSSSSLQPPPPPLQPTSAHILSQLETRRRDLTVSLGLCTTGCADVDGYVLSGGFERGSVVGVSCEEEEFGMTLGIQIMVRNILDGRIEGGHVVSMRSRSVVLGVLRGCIRGEVESRQQQQQQQQGGMVKWCMDRVMLTCIFDMTGLWEVLSTLDDSNDSNQQHHDDDDEQQNQERTTKQGEMILITTFGELLTDLFTQRQNQAAHASVQLLSGFLRHLSRTCRQNYLIMLLNSTTTTTTSTTEMLDSRLRSVFQPHHQSTRIKPHFGMVFAQILDLHVLCSSIPKDGSPSGGWVTAVEVLVDDIGVWEKNNNNDSVNKEGEEGRSKRRREDREGRWGAVMLRMGRIVDAFPGKGL